MLTLNHSKTSRTLSVVESDFKQESTIIVHHAKLSDNFEGKDIELKVSFPDIESGEEFCDNITEEESAVGKVLKDDNVVYVNPEAADDK